jgi:hypothetical protein
MLAGGECVASRANSGKAAVVGGDIFLDLLLRQDLSCPEEIKKLYYFSGYSVFLMLLYSKINSRRNAKLKPSGVTA